jgi:AcrR family transcriptional regulator
MRQVPSSIAAKLPAAASLFAERGLDQTKIEDVAEATGIPKATLYYYFSGKEEILSFLLADSLNLIADAVAIAVDAPGTARERLGLVVQAQLRVMSEQRDVCRALIADLGRAGRIPETAEAINRAYYQPVLHLLIEGAEDGSLRKVEDPASASVAIFGAVTISALSYLVSGADLAADQVAEQLIGMLVDGLGPRKGGGKK